VGAEISEYLGLPNVSNVLSVDDYRDGKLQLTVSLDDAIVSLEIGLPCLISMDSDINTPRLPSYRIKKSLPENAVRFLSFKDFEDQDANHYGLSGSATQVERIYPPEKITEKQVITGDAQAQTDALFALLAERKML
jgi:electron transfer flavoprotein beta subunit